jgi:two-component system, cell cycle response regulator CpdR
MARILLAEDDEAVRQFVLRALQMKGHEVVEAADGEQAAEIADAEAGQFDLLLSDIKMPVMDGIALAFTVAANYPAMTILLMSGFADQRERANGLEELVHDIILKPFTLGDLLETVEAALAGHPAAIVPLAQSGLGTLR